MRNIVFDGYQRVAPRERKSEPAVIVEIDEKSLALLGQWPWPRTRLADLVDRIAAAKPAAIGIDLLFPEPDRFSPATLAIELPVIASDMADKLRAYPSTDSRLAQAFQNRPVVLGIAGIEAVDARYPNPPQVVPMRFAAGADKALRLPSYPGHVQSIPELDRAASGRGLLSSAAEGGIVRRAPLLAEVHGVKALSFAMEILRVASGGVVHVEDHGSGALTIKLAELTIPLRDDGTVWLRTSRHDPERFVSAADVLTGKTPREKLENKLVLVGVTGLGLVDQQVTVLRDSVPGIEIHAQLIEQLMEGHDLSRPLASLWAEIALIVVGGIFIIVLTPKRKVQRVLGAAAIAAAALAALGFGAFLWAGVLIDIAWPLVSAGTLLVITLAGSLAESDRQQRLLRVSAAHMAGELTAAKRIQMGLLPKPQEVFAGEHRFTVAAVLEPARTVGGDFYDCFMLDEKRLFFVVADVSGKGLPAAVFMASAKSHLKSAALTHEDDVAGIVARAQAEIARENPEQMFITLFAGVLDVETGRLEYVNAGHDAPFAKKPGHPPVRLEQAGGPPLGVMDNFDYASGSRPLAPGEWLAVMTDGVTEAGNTAGEFFGTARLTAALDEPPPLEWPNEVVRRIGERVHAFAAGREPADDMTLLVVRWNGVGAQGMGGKQEDA